MTVKSYILFFYISFSCIYGIAQDNKPTSAPEIRGFSLSPDRIGSVANSVNLYTGDLNLPINLTSLQGRNGLDVNVSISYNSNVQNQVDSWNLDSPTGILGLGWSYDVPKIIADTKQTGTREDDSYYLIEGGGSNQLIRTTSGTDSQGSYYVYETKNYQFWKIKFYFDSYELNGTTSSGSNFNKWEIIRENGFKYVYGDKTSGRNTLQFVVRWGNWIGSSARASGQSQMVSVWNISEIVNLVGEKVLFEYDSEEQFVGGYGGRKHTEASYLKQITDVVGRKVKFYYLNKESSFYMEPHTEQAEPDAYQEVYEKKYLDHIDVILENGQKHLSLNFRYSSINSGTNTAKMLLTNIEERNNSNNSLPGTSFEYYQASDANGYKGFLKKVIYPTGGYTLYTYKMSSNSINNSLRNRTINAPPAESGSPYGFGEPKVWLGNDYVIVAWRALGSGNSHISAPMAVKLFAYQWVGEWKEFPLGTYGVSLYGEMNPYIPNPFMDYKDFQVVVEDNFCAVMYHTEGSNVYHLDIKYKDPNARGKWLSYFTSYDYGSGSPKLLSGDNFVAVGSFWNQIGQETRLFTFVGNGWRDEILSQPLNQHNYSSANNYFISHEINSSFSALRLNFLSEDKRWITRDFPSNLSFTSYDPSNWYTTNSLALVMAAGPPEYVYRWDLTYSNFYRDDKNAQNNDLLGYMNDNFRVFILNNSMIGIRGRLARFDGALWNTEDITTIGTLYAEDYFTYGDDFAIRPTENVSGTSKYKGGRKVFDPNTLTWLPDFIMDGVDAGDEFPKAGIDSYYFGNGFYYRSPSGLWIKKFTYPTYSSIRRFKMGFPRTILTEAIYPMPTQEIREFKNGEINTILSSPDGSRLLNSYTYFKSNGFDGQTIVSFPSGSGDFTVTTSLNIRRIINSNYYGNQTDYPITVITNNDGTSNYYTKIDYDFATATIDPSGVLAQYHEVTVTPGSNDSNYKPSGYTKTYFYNGLTLSDYPSIPYNENLLLSGQISEVKHFNTSNQVVSFTTNQIAIYPKDFFNSNNQKVGVGYYLRPLTSSNLVDNITSNSMYTYNSLGQLKTEKVFYLEPNGSTPNLVKEYVYWWEKYDPTNLRNILTPVIQELRSKSDDLVLPVVYTNSTVTRWKDWVGSSNQTVPIEFDSYVWKGVGNAPNIFSTWDASIKPPSNWALVNRVKSRDVSTSVILETILRGETKVCLVWDQSRIQPIAQIHNASYSDVAFSSFEPNQNGNWEGLLTPTLGNSKTGAYFNELNTTGLTKSGLTSTEKYVISFWARTANGSIQIDGVGTIPLGNISDWTYFEYIVTGLSSYSIKKIGTNSVQIDELRFHPINARMTSFTFDLSLGVTSQTNQNNITTYTEYDEFRRSKNILDQDRNIIKTQSFNFKKP